MSHAPHPTAAAGQGAAGPRPAPGELWLFTQDHRRLAWLYAILIGFGLVVGTLLALGLVLQSLAGRGAGATAEGYRRLYTVHGLAMVFAVALPAIPGIVGNWLLPQRLAVREMAWPRLNLLAFHLLLCAWLLFLVAFLAAPPDAGWSFEVPLALESGSGVAWSMLAVVFALTSVAIAGANAVATLVASRIAGRSFADITFFGWALGLAGLLQALAAPVLIVALALLFAERTGASDVLAAAGADARFDGWFRLWASPALAGLLLGAIGVIGDVLETRGDADAFPGRATFASVLALFAVVILAWACGAAADGATASALGLAALVPLAVLVAEWLLALSRGRVHANAALCFAASAAVALVAGALAGAFEAGLPTRAHLANTTFAPGALHLLAVGGVLGALLAGLHQAWSRWFGKRVREGLGRSAAFLLLSGTLLAFVPPCVLGYLGEPRHSAGLVTARPALAWTAVAGAGLIVAALALAAWGLFATLLDARASLARRETE